MTCVSIFYQPCCRHVENINKSKCQSSARFKGGEDVKREGFFCIAQEANGGYSLIHLSLFDTKPSYHKNLITGST